MSKSKKETKKIIGIFRALDVRMPHAEFTNAFSKFNAALITHENKNTVEIINQVKKLKITIPLKPFTLFDPIYPLLKKTDFTPWMEFDHETLDAVTKRIDIFEVYEPYFFYSSQIANLAKNQSKPLITEIWTSFPTHPSRYLFPYSWNVKNVIKKTDLFVMRSEKARSYLEPYEIEEKTKVVIYHGVNLKRFYPAKNKKEGKLQILFVGALAAHKGLDDLLDVFIKLNDKYPDKLELVICGEGPLAKKVTSLSKVTPIHFLGKVSQLDLPEIYRSADIYCQPSKDFYFLNIKGGEEFAGYTFMEAMASGLPIVTTFCGGIPEIVGNENKLVMQGSKKELFTALDKYISNKSLRKETGIKNRKRAEKYFDIDKQTEILEQVITDRLL